MLPGPASQRGAGRAGREATALEPPRPSTPFSCFLVRAGWRRRDWLRERGPERMAQASRASRNPEPRAAASAAFVRGRGATKRGGRPPEVAAAARAPLPSALRRRLAGRLGLAWEASPWSERPAWTWHGPRAPRQPSLTEGIFFLSPFPLPAIFRRGLPGGRGAGRCARCAPGSRLCAPAPLCWRRPGRIVSGQAGQAGPGLCVSLARGASGGVAWGAAAAFAELWPGNDFALSRVTDYCSQARKKPSSHFEISPKEY